MQKTKKEFEVDNWNYDANAKENKKKTISFKPEIELNRWERFILFIKCIYRSFDTCKWNIIVYTLILIS